MKKNSRYYIRKTHRYLGIFIGIQLLLWTAGGLYFSWNDIDKIHGDHLRKALPLLPGNLLLSSPDSALAEMRKETPVDSILSIELINVLDKPVYRIVYFSHDDQANVIKKYALANAETGNLRGELTEKEAVAIAKSLFIPDSKITGIEYIRETGPHSEYREKPLPAWAIHFDHPSKPVIYIGAQTGAFTSIRHDNWRIFDFLWMLHTMDYKSRDDFGNVLLKSFSILGLITVLSGFLLFYVSSPMLRKGRKKKTDR